MIFLYSFFVCLPPDFLTMKKTIILSVLLLLGSWALFAQKPVQVYEGTLKIKPMQDENLYFGFAAGDQIVIHFSETGNKELKEFEVAELPNNSKYKDVNVTKIKDKHIYVGQKSVYRFTFSNGSLSNRTCKVKILRIPGSAETADFNTGWKWTTVYDTTYVSVAEDSIVGYDTLTTKKVARNLLSSELKEYDFLDKTVNVPARGIVKHDNPRMCVPINLPKLESSETCKQEVMAWAYWMGVGPSADNFFSRNKGTLVNLSGLLTANPLAKLALGVATALVIPDDSKIDPVWYAVTDEAGKAAFMEGEDFHALDYGRGKGSYARFSDADQCQGPYYVCIKNENIHNSVDVTVKAVAIVKVETYKEKDHERTKTTPRYTSVDKMRMEITPRQIRVNIE